jgi:hypothetical protein
LSHFTSPFLWRVFRDKVYRTIYLALNHNLPDLCLLSS